LQRENQLERFQRPKERHLGVDRHSLSQII
jgi:hypothetical protein